MCIANTAGSNICQSEVPVLADCYISAHQVDVATEVSERDSFHMNIIQSSKIQQQAAPLPSEADERSSTMIYFAIIFLP